MTCIPSRRSSCSAVITAYTGITGNTYSGAPYTIDQAGVKIAQPPNKGGGNNAGLNFSTNTFGVGTQPYGVWNRGNQSLREIFTWTKGNNLLQFGGQAIRHHPANEQRVSRGAATSSSSTWQPATTWRISY